MHVTTGIIETELDGDHECVQNYDGSLGAMESDGLLPILKELYDQYENKTYVETVVTDNDTRIKNYCTHPSYLPRGVKNIGGCLSAYMIEPKWFADPTYRDKCVAGVFFERTK